MTRTRSWLRRHPVTIAFAIVVVAVIVAFVRIQNVSNDQVASIKAASDQRVEDQAKINDSICESDAQLRQTVIDLVGILGQEVPEDPNLDAATLQRVKVANAQRRAAREAANGVLHPQKCADGIAPTPQAPSISVPSGG